MYKLVNKLYEQSELAFALLWIIIYCVSNSIGNVLSDMIEINSSITFGINAILTTVMLLWIYKNNLYKKYGLCKAQLPASKFLWYIPLIIFVSHNLWLGINLNVSMLDMIFYIANMIAVGLLEELIFRGFLFKAMAKDNVNMAIIISSVTFGIGHILNLFNGSGMELVANMCQIAGAIACGFLFVIIFHRGGSLVPCIIAHIVNNAINIFSNEAAMTNQKMIVIASVNLIIVITYILVLLRTVPKEK